MKTKIRFKDLSWPLKLGIVTSWIYAGLFVIAFMSGFIAGVLGF